MNGSLSDPMENLKRTNSFGSSHNQSNSKVVGAGGQPQIPQEYNPSMYDQQSNKRPGAGGEHQIAETKDRRKRETQEQEDWWEKRKEPQFTVKMPSKPHPSQHGDHPMTDSSAAIIQPLVPQAMDRTFQPDKSAMGLGYILASFVLLY